MPVSTQQNVWCDWCNGCFLTVRIAGDTRIRLLVQTALPVRVGSWVWAQAMLARKQIAGFDNYPYPDLNAPLNALSLPACHLHVDTTHDDNPLLSSLLPP